MRDSSVVRWVSRIERAVALLKARLDNPPRLQELAAAAEVSPYHLHRVWRALVGETVGQTVRRVRLQASEELLAKHRSVTEIAATVGFATSQSYARAFRRRTGISPTQHRRDHAESPLGGDSNPNVVVERRGELVVIVLRREGKPYTDLNSTFGAIWEWAGTRGVRGQLTGIYGVPLDDPASIPIDQLRYDACLSFAEVTNPPLPFQSLVLPGGDYARLRHKGHYNGLEDVDQYLVGEWLPGSGREPGDFPVFHQFHNDPDQTPANELETDVLLLLK